MTIKQAGNSNGDYVLFRRVTSIGEIHYQVYVYNNTTCHSLLAFHETIAVGALAREQLEEAAKIVGMATFEEACDFMGIEMEDEDDGK